MLVADRSTGAQGSGARLRQVREQQGLSLRAFAQQLEVSPATLSAAETGLREMPAARLERAARLLGVATDELLRPGHGIRRDATVGDPPDWRTFPPLQLDAPLSAALAAFLELGYHGATMRDIARRADLSVPGVYHHYASKQQMLVAILDVTMADLRSRSQAARTQGEGPVQRFALLVECLALFHTHRRELGFVGASEMRSLLPPDRERVAAVRRAQQRMVDDEVEQACDEGTFAVTHPREASRAVVTMCTALPQWFDGRGPDSPEQVAQQYVEFALDLMRCSAKGRRLAGRRPGRPGS